MSIAPLKGLRALLGAFARAHAPCTCGFPTDVRDSIVVSRERGRDAIIAHVILLLRAERVDLLSYLASADVRALSTAEQVRTSVAAFIQRRGSLTVESDVADGLLDEPFVLETLLTPRAPREHSFLELFELDLCDEVQQRYPMLDAPARVARWTRSFRYLLRPNSANVE